MSCLQLSSKWIRLKKKSVCAECLEDEGTEHARQSLQEKANVARGEQQIRIMGIQMFTVFFFRLFSNLKIFKIKNWGKKF